MDASQSSLSGAARLDRAAVLNSSEEARRQALLTRFRFKVASTLGVSIQQVDPDANLTALAASFDDARIVYLPIESTLRRELRTNVFLSELFELSTLNALAGYFARELFHPALPTQPPVDDPFEGGEWGWGPVSRAPNPAMRRPGILFVLSAPRSGSTLLRVMLAGHPRLFSPPELVLLPFDTMGERAQKFDSLGYGWLRLGLNAALTELEGLTREGAVERTGALEHQNLPISDVYRSLQSAIGDRLLVDKSPLYTFHPDWLQRAEGMFDRPKYLFLYRHPYSVIESFVRTRFHKILGRHWLFQDENPWRLAEKAWAISNRHTMDFLQGVEPARQHAVRYEDLVRGPEAMSRRLCEFLGVPYAESITKPYEGNRMTRDEGRRMLTIGDPNIHDHDRIDPELADVWKQTQPPRLGAFARRVASDLGYEVPS